MGKKALNSGKQTGKGGRKVATPQASEKQSSTSSRVSDAFDKEFADLFGDGPVDTDPPAATTTTTTTEPNQDGQGLRASPKRKRRRRKDNKKSPQKDLESEVG